MTTPRGAMRGNFAAQPRASPRTVNPSPSPVRKGPLIAWNGAEASPAAASSSASSSSIPRRSGPDDRINVYLRPRPADANAAADGRHDREQVQVFADAEAKTVSVYAADTSKTIPCDGLIPADASQDEMYAAVGTRFVDGAMQGLSGCIFAYGQTGSGKTWTVNGLMDGTMNEHRGLAPRLLDDLFAQIELAPAGRTYTVSVEFVEVHNETLKDLLYSSTGSSSSSSGLGSAAVAPPKLTIYDVGKRVHVAGSQKIQVSSSADAQRWLVAGQANRATGSTAMNASSSRSHSIFSLTVECVVEGAGAEGQPLQTVSKVNIVDLAGSESQKAGITEGERRKEGNKINQSLSTLSMVIQELKEGRVPSFRSSKLTHLLRDSLGGNSLTTLIATINTSVSHLATTLSTMQFAERAQALKMDAQKGVVQGLLGPASIQGMDGNLLRKRFEDMQRENSKVIRENQQLKQQMALNSAINRHVAPSSSSTTSGAGSSPAQYELLVSLLSKNAAFLDACMRSNATKDQLLADAADLVESLEASRDDLEEQMDQLRRGQVTTLLPFGGEQGAGAGMMMMSPNKHISATMPIGGAELSKLVSELRLREEDERMSEHMTQLHALEQQKRLLRQEAERAGVRANELANLLAERDAELADKDAQLQHEALEAHDLQTILQDDVEREQAASADLRQTVIDLTAQLASQAQDADEQIERLEGENQNLQTLVAQLQAELQASKKQTAAAATPLSMQQQQLMFPLSLTNKVREQHEILQRMNGAHRTPLGAVLQPQQQAQVQSSPSATTKPTRLSALFSAEKAARFSSSGNANEDGELKTASPDHHNLQQHRDQDEEAANDGRPSFSSPAVVRAGAEDASEYDGIIADENSAPLTPAASPPLPHHKESSTRHFSMSPVFYAPPANDRNSFQSPRPLAPEVAVQQEQQGRHSYHTRSQAAMRG